MREKKSSQKENFYDARSFGLLSLSVFTRGLSYSSLKCNWMNEKVVKLFMRHEAIDGKFERQFVYCVEGAEILIESLLISLWLRFKHNFTHYSKHIVEEKLILNCLTNVAGVLIID